MPNATSIASLGGGFREKPKLNGNCATVVVDFVITTTEEVRDALHATFAKCVAKALFDLYASPAS